MFGGVAKLQNNILAIVIACMLIGVAFGGEDRTYYNQAVKLIGVVENVLIKNDLCSSSNDCSVRKMAFWGVNKGGVSITIYNIRNHEIMARLVDALMEWYVKDPSYDMEVVIFDKRWEDANKVFFLRNPVLRLTAKHGGEKRKDALLRTPRKSQFSPSQQ